jgi:multidrug transporter EmrE-like cation transporter
LTLHGLILVVLSALLTVAANLLMRGGINRAGGFYLDLKTVQEPVFSLVREPMFLVGVLLYGTAAVVWFRVLSFENLSSSYPLLISLTFILVTLGAAIFFQEQISVLKVTGLVVILVGIVIVAYS